MIRPAPDPHRDFAVLLIFAFAFFAASSLARPETAEGRGLRIATEAERRAEGFGDLVATAEMTLMRSGRPIAVRRLRSHVLERDDDGDRALVVFDEPADLRGTALLSWSHDARDDDQWLFLPALRRVKRISGKSRSGSFVGSELSYEDLAPVELQAYSYRALENETLETALDGAALRSVECWVIERTPLRASGYSRQVVWLDQDHYRPLRVDSYDRRETLIKTLELTGYRLYRERFWQPHRLEMRHHKTGRATILELSDYRLGQGLTADDFDPDRLQDIR